MTRSNTRIARGMKRKYGKAIPLGLPSQKYLLIRKLIQAGKKVLDSNGFYVVIDGRKFPRVIYDRYMAVRQANQRALAAKKKEGRKQDEPIITNDAPVSDT